MVLTYLDWVIVFVAVNTTKRHEIARNCVAFITSSPFILVFSTVNREIHVVVIKRRRYPGIFIMATLTISREACKQVIGIICTVIIGFVATEAFRRCVDIVSTDVAVYTLWYIGMRTVEWPD